MVFSIEAPPSGNSQIVRQAQALPQRNVLQVKVDVSKLIDGAHNEKEP